MRRAHAHGYIERDRERKANEEIKKTNGQGHYVFEDGYRIWIANHEAKRSAIRKNVHGINEHGLLQWFFPTNY